MNRFLHISQNWPAFVEERRLALLEICRQHHLKRLWLFGSVLQPERFRPDSDVDVLFEYDRPAIKDDEYLRNYYSFQKGVEKLFGRKVDLVHRPSLKNPYFIEEMKEKACLFYDQEAEKVSLRYQNQH